jgi:hypothetical protein
MKMNELNRRSFVNSAALAAIIGSDEVRGNADVY